MRLLGVVWRSTTSDPIRLRLSSTVTPGNPRQIIGLRPGPRSVVTVEALSLAMLLSVDLAKSYRRSDLSSVLAGLHLDVARLVGLTDNAGNLIVPSYQALARQVLRMERVLREGWTVVEPSGKRVRYDLRWFIREMIRASVPRHQRRRIRHIAVDATDVRSWGGWRRGVRKADIDSEPVALHHRLTLHGAEQKKADLKRSGLTEQDLKTAELTDTALHKTRRAAENRGSRVPYGPDNRPMHSKDSESRIGHKSSNSDGPAGPFMGFDLHLGAAAATVNSNNSLRDIHLDAVPQYVIAMSLDPALTNCGPIGARLVAEARELCPDITECTADRGFTEKLAFAPQIRAMGINVNMDYPITTLQKPRFVDIGKREQRVLLHAGTFLSEFTPNDKHLLPAPPEDLIDGSLSAEAQTEALEAWQSDWYEERFRLYGWSFKDRYDDGRIGLRSAEAAGRVKTERATAASGNGNFSAPYFGPEHQGRATVVAHPDELHKWQMYTYGTRSWERVYGSGRSTIESVNSEAKDKGRLAHGTCRAFGIVANSLAALSVVVIHNLQVTDRAAARAAKTGNGSNGSGSPQQSDRCQQPGRHPRPASRAPP